MSHDATKTVTAYLEALEAADVSAARAWCVDSATVWHNDGKGDETLEEYFAGLTIELAKYASIHYDIIRQVSLPGGVLQQHVVRVVARSGERGGVHAAVYFGIDTDGLIDRIEAYANYIPEEPGQLLARNEAQENRNSS